MSASAAPELKRDLGLVAVMSLVVGSVIGSGIFMKPGKVIEAAGSSNMALLAWVLGGIITMASGLVFAEIGAQIPKTGGVFVYLEEIYGSLWGYLCGWTQTALYGPAVMAALGLYFGEVLADFFALPLSYMPLVAAGAICLLAAVNCLGVKYGGYIQTCTTFVKLIPIIFIALFGLAWGKSDILGMPGVGTHHLGMGAAMLACLWAYDGWILVGYVAGEMKDPAKTLPRAIIMGLGIVIGVYLLVNMAILHVLPASSVVRLGPMAAETVSIRLFGDHGGKLLTIGILVSIFGTLNAKILAFPRIPYAMSVRGQLPASRLWSRLHQSWGTPVYATGLLVAIALILLTVGDPDRLTNIALFLMYVFYLQTLIGVFILRRRGAGAARPYSVPGYPFVPWVAILGVTFVLVTTLVDEPKDVLYALGVAAIGLPVRWAVKRRSESPSS